MNYELLETVIWTDVRGPGGECVGVCVMNDGNKEL